MATIYLALGSNVGDSKAHMEHAMRLLSSQVTHIKQAPIYISRAVGYADQADFLNTAIRGQTDLTHTELLGFVKNIERQVGRVERFRWGPREIDIDIIFYGGQVVEDSNLTLPHPRFRERDFVLRPLCDIAPKAIDPVTKLTVQELLLKLPQSERSVLRKLTV